MRLHRCVPLGTAMTICTWVFQVSFLWCWIPLRSLRKGCYSIGLLRAVCLHLPPLQDMVNARPDPDGDTLVRSDRQQKGIHLRLPLPVLSFVSFLLHSTLFYPVLSFISTCFLYSMLAADTCSSRRLRAFPWSSCPLTNSSGPHSAVSNFALAADGYATR
jgi:hypothetical protein